MQKMTNVLQIMIIEFKSLVQDKEHNYGSKITQIASEVPIIEACEKKKKNCKLVKGVPRKQIAETCLSKQFKHFRSAVL